MTRYTDRIVNHMISHMVKRVREVLNKYVSITITDMTDLIPELLYYIKWAEYIQKLQEQGFTFAKASVYKEGENESDPYMMQARGIYNLKLAVFETEESGNIVPNDMDFDRNRRVYILTGANRLLGSCLCWRRVAYIFREKHLHFPLLQVFTPISRQMRTRHWI